MSRETKIIKLKLDIIFKRIFGNEKNDNKKTAKHKPMEDWLKLINGERAYGY